jgi:hypothetical protein
VASRLQSSIIIVVVVLFILSGIMLPRLFRSSPRAAASGIGVTANGEAYRWSDKEVTVFENKAGTLVIAVIGHREYEDDENKQQTGNYMAFYDALNGKELGRQRLTGIAQDRLNDADFSLFQNGDIYAIVNKSLLYKIDKVNTRLVPVPADFFTHQEELAAGIAQVEFIGPEWGDGLKLVTNDGKNRTYFPIADKVFTDKSRYAAEKTLAVKEPGAKTRTYFLFSEPSDDFPDEPIRLMMYTQKDNQGGPNTRPFFQKRDYSFLYNKKTISDFRQGGDYVLSYRDLTPGRAYFSPEVLYSDNEYVLIQSKANAASTANTLVQCLSVPGGRLVFTLPVDKEHPVDHIAYRYSHGFVLKTYESVLVIDSSGKQIKEFKIMQ